MASIGHVAVGMAGARAHAGGLTQARPSVLIYMLFGALALLPDLDAIAFHFRIRYGAEWGHRGAAHSLAIALGVGIIGGLLARRVRTGLFVAAVVASHGLLDTMTDGGLGVALWWPFTQRRYFAPWRPIPVAPIGVGMISQRGLYVVGVEAIYFLPFVVYALWWKKRSGVRKRTP